MSLCLLLVDIQNDYFPGGKCELADMPAASKKAHKLLTFFREKNLSLIHIQHVDDEEDANFFAEGTEGAKIHESVAPIEGEQFIQKHLPNAFYETGLDGELKEAAIDDLVICGAMSHMCIDATARSALDLGYNCVVIHDACASKDMSFEDKKLPAKEVHAAFMSALSDAGCHVMDLETLFSDL